MQVQRRARTVAIMGLAVVVLGVLAERVLLVAGGVALAAWLVGRQAAAVRAVRAVDRDLTLDVTPIRRRVPVDDEVRLAVTARVDGPAPAPTEIRVNLPVAADGPPVDDRTLRLDAGETEAGTTVEFTVPTAGRYEIPQASVTVRPRDGLFTETLPRGPTPTVTVAARTPADLRIGRGGEEVAMAYGEHPAGRGAGGISPEEIRQFQPGDATDQIDWKATARLDDLYVREFEAETDRRSVLVFDHRGATDLGHEGATLFAYLREVALSFTDAAERLSDPVGCWTVGDDGVTNRHDPTTAASGYNRIRTTLSELVPTVRPPVTADGSVPTAGGAVGDGDPGDARTGRTDAITADTRGAHPGRAALADARLATDETPFARRLRPFLGSRTSYVRRIEGDPLFGAVRSLRAETSGTTWTVLFTDDARRDRVREAARLATRGGDHAVVFLAPRVLFDGDVLADPEAAYDRYVAAEEFRRDLDGLPRVTAFEVGPGDRLDRLLAAGRRDR
ncbi:DUF58 domain-containing protein [Halobaculum sp. WSA2]|uniref:DUF58 domain-containing protein n=1 Tax=Halobaculum saliterrae TaxID=2073113 RepID=A0A6B0SQF5_9EURY|nr:DUF58 domain-containing protein [Halobaculum saliterrae]MXR40707.1 DUF58 domain-containing protein [Halobaculum saliterrae]